MATLEVPYEEWEVLYRLRLQVERDLLALRARVEARPSPVASGFGLAAALLGRLLPERDPADQDPRPGVDGNRTIGPEAPPGQER